MLWPLVLGLMLPGAGAAVGAVLSAQVIGEMPVAVSQALTIDTAAHIPVGFASYGGHEYGAWSAALPDRWFVSYSDDGTGFTAAGELNTGDKALIIVYLANRAKKDLVGEISLILPQGITAEIAGEAAIGNIDNITRTALYTWRMRVDDTCGDQPGNAAIVIHIGVADNIQPGFYKIDGVIKQVAY